MRCCATAANFPARTMRFVPQHILPTLTRGNLGESSVVLGSYLRSIYGPSLAIIPTVPSRREGSCTGTADQYFSMQLSDGNLIDACTFTLISGRLFAPYRLEFPRRMREPHASEV
jgi:hypothetical protein